MPEDGIQQGSGEADLTAPVKKHGATNGETAPISQPESPPASHNGTFIPNGLADRLPPLYHADRDGNFVYRNSAFNELAARMFPEFQSSERRDLPCPLAPFELRQIFDRLTAGETSIRSRQTMEIDGDRHHYRSNHFRIVEDGEIVGFGGTYTDVTLEAEAVTNSVRAESRFQDVIRSASDWVWETDRNLNISYISNRISDAIETSPETLKGRYLFTLGTFEDEAEFSNSQPDPTAALLPFRGRIFLMKDRRGRTRRISLTGVPVFDEGTGAFAGYRGTGTDVTRQLQLEKRARKTQEVLESSLTVLRERNNELDHALAEAKTAAQAKNDFLGKMSHELRTPLNAIIGFAEMSIHQAFGALNTRYLSYFRDIHGAAHHLLTIINDILDAVNVESSKITVSIEPMRLAQVISEAKSILSVRADQREIDLSAVDIPDDWIVLADPVRTRQILVNLLNNSIKFTNPGGSIGIDVHEIGTDELAFTVWDTGIGIPEDQLDLIFDSFHQVKSDLLSDPTEGTGLGLTISRQLAQLMGGDISVDSAPGRGSRFTVRLPRTTVEQLRAAQKTLEKVTSA